MLDLRFVAKVCGIGGVIKMLRWSAMLKKTMPLKDIAYLWFIGVNPVSQNKGIGSQLLTEILANERIEFTGLY